MTFDPDTFDGNSFDTGGTPALINLPVASRPHNRPRALTLIEREMRRNMKENDPFRKP